MSAAMVMFPQYPASEQAKQPALQILPRVWATAEPAGALAVVTARKQPQSLRLVQAAAVSAAPAAVPRWTPMTTRRAEAPVVAFYRKYTEAMLRRYGKMSMEQGRVPSLLGRELFRGKVTHYQVTAFDDAVIFVHDVGRTLEQLDAGQRLLIRRIAIEEYALEEAAAKLGLSLRTVVRRYAAALDKLTRVLLERKMLEPMMACEEED